MSHQFSEAERAVLRIVQADLPDTLTPAKRASAKPRCWSC